MLLLEHLQFGSIDHHLFALFWVDLSFDVQVLNHSELVLSKILFISVLGALRHLCEVFLGCFHPVFEGEEQKL